jgi:hypothetical protein
MKIFTFSILFLLGTINHVYAQVVPGSVVEEKISNFLSTPASNYSVEIPVIIIRYLPTLDGVNIDVVQATDFWELGYIRLDTLKSYIDKYDKRVKFSLEQGSRYHGYKDAASAPYLGYKVIKYITVYRQMQPGIYIRDVGNKKGYQTDYKKEFADLNLTNFIKINHVKEVWIWSGEAAEPGWPSYNPAIHTNTPYYVWQAESNMSSPTTGDISNSSRIPDDLPIVDHTYVVYGQNFRRTQAEAVHNHGHQLECIYKYTAERQEGNPTLFVQKFSGWGDNNFTVPPTGRAGDCHHPPNTTIDYDYFNTTLIMSDIEDWQPNGGTRKLVNSDTWGNLSYNWPGETEFPQRKESQWYLYWMQNMPGARSSIPYNSNVMTNWWKFTADWDICFNNRIGLYESPTQSEINPPESDKSIKVYPNPATNELTIEFEGNSDRTHFEILNSIGQIVYSGILIEKTVLQTTSFAPGIYLIRLKSGDTIEFKKILVKKY